MQLDYNYKKVLPSSDVEEVIFSPGHTSDMGGCTCHKTNHRLLAVTSLSYTSSFQGLHSFILTHTEQAHSRQIDLEIMNTPVPQLKSMEHHKFIVSSKAACFYLPSFH